MEKREYKEYKNKSLWKEEDDDIVFWNYSPDLEINITNAKEMIKNRLEYFKGESFYTLVDVTNIKSTTKEAREYINSPEGGLKGILGGAFLSKSVVSNVVVNFYLKINKPSIPAKFFTKKEEALFWLKELKKHNKSFKK